MGDDWPEMTVEGFQSRFMGAMRVKVTSIRADCDYPEGPSTGEYRGGEMWNIPERDPCVVPMVCVIIIKAEVMSMGVPKERIRLTLTKGATEAAMPMAAHLMLDDGENIINGFLDGVRQYTRAVEGASCVAEMSSKPVPGPCIGIAETTAKPGEPAQIMITPTSACKITGLSDHDTPVAGINKASDALRNTLTGFLDDGKRTCINPHCRYVGGPGMHMGQPYCRRCWTKFSAEDDWPSTDTSDVKPLVFEEVP